MPEASFVSIRTPEAPPSTATRRREDSMCAAVLEHADGVVVPAASLDARFRHNPFVTGPLGDVRSYASAPLTTPDGVIIGRLCVFDSTPPPSRRSPGGVAGRCRRTRGGRPGAAAAHPPTAGLAGGPDAGAGEAAPIQQGALGLRRAGEPRPAHAADRDHGQHRAARPGGLGSSRRVGGRGLGLERVVRAPGRRGRSRPCRSACRGHVGRRCRRPVGEPWTRRPAGLSRHARAPAPMIGHTPGWPGRDGGNPKRRIPEWGCGVRGRMRRGRSAATASR